MRRTLLGTILEVFTTSEGLAPTKEKNKHAEIGVLNSTEMVNLS